MRSVEFQSQSLGALLFILCHTLGLLVLGAVGHENLEVGAVIIITCDFVLLVRATSRDRAMLLPLLFAIVYTLFHFSLLPIAIFNYEFLLVHPYFSYWYFDVYTKSAYWISLIFFIFMIAGALAARRKDYRCGAVQMVQEDEQRSNVLLLIFAGLVAFFLAGVFYILGISNYAKYNEIARADTAGFVAQSLILVYPMIGALAIVCADRVKSLTLFLFLFGAWALPAFATGLRGEVLFPAALMTPLLLRRLRIRFRLVPVVAISLALLWLISFGRLSRVRGDWSEAFRNATPIDALAELGGSLRPVFEVARWTETGMMEFLWGLTYWAPVERLLLRVLPFVEPIPAVLDDRLMNVRIDSLTGGAYGFSIAAEAYVNFGYVGTAVIGSLTGLALALIGRRFTIGRVGVLSAALAYAIFYHIRQSYVGAWGSFIVVAGFTWMIMLIDNKARRFISRAVPGRAATTCVRTGLDGPK